jgi:hypothetical protein
MRGTTRKKLALALACLLLVLFVAQGLAFNRANSQTYDESLYLAAGYSYLARGDFRLMPEHPPLLKELIALPVYLRYRLPFTPDPRQWDQSALGPEPADHAAELLTISRDFLYGSSVPADDILTLARLPVLALGAVLVALVGWWAYRLWGEVAALAGMALAALEPNLVAHASVATTDLGTTLFIFLTLYLFWEHVQARSGRLLLAAGVTTGLALGCKHSSVFLLGVLGLVGAVYAWSGGVIPLPGVAPERMSAGRGGRLARAFLATAGVACVAALVLLPLYFFQGLGTWLHGFRWQLAHQGHGHPAFFLGRHGTHGWWAYFPVAFLLKTPLGTLLAVLAALLPLRSAAPWKGRDALFVLLPPALYLLAVLPARTAIGLRFLLPVYPFLLVAAARVATVRSRSAPVLVFLLLTATALSSLRVSPFPLTYFNELAGGPENGPRYLSDSNLDWGQGLRGLGAFLERQGWRQTYLSYFGSAPPGYYVRRYQPLPEVPPDLPGHSCVLPPGAEREVLAIGVTHLQGVYLPDPDLYLWLRERTPVACIGYSIYVYELTGDADAHLHLARLYEQTGRHDLAAAEARKSLLLAPDSTEARDLLGRLGKASDGPRNPLQTRPN